ncbi:hypothetical protein DPMN_193737 [Dreissena polymorpha]|uniref:Uncharacterized protein n=1 Tax=Dreissena polymorpha TaxID=45954 RepID=A0A9D4BCI3_DREPO|nr:hypothetical protein DPMN_193737 [Dreissena polymorpha]
MLKTTNLSISRAGHAESHWTRGPMARESNHYHIMTEVLAPKLGPYAHLLGQFKDL